MSTPDTMTPAFHDALLPLAARATCTALILRDHGWRSASVLLHAPATLPDQHRVREAIRREMRHWSAWAEPAALPLQWWLPGSLLTTEGGGGAAWATWLAHEDELARTRGIFLDGDPRLEPGASALAGDLGPDVLVRLRFERPLSTLQREWRQRLPGCAPIWCGVPSLRWTNLERRSGERVLLPMHPRQHVAQAIARGSAIGWTLEWASAQPHGAFDPLAPLWLATIEGVTQPTSS